MFTGIVEELGEVTAVENLGDSSRFTLRANALSLSFFFTEETFTSATRLLGCTRATAVINPTSSSTARMALSIRLLRSYPRNGAWHRMA